MNTNERKLILDALDALEVQRVRVEQERDWLANRLRHTRFVLQEVANLTPRIREAFAKVRDACKGQATMRGAYSEGARATLWDEARLWQQDLDAIEAFEQKVEVLRELSDSLVEVGFNQPTTEVVEVKNERNEVVEFTLLKRPALAPTQAISGSNGPSNLPTPGPSSDAPKGA